MIRISQKELYAVISEHARIVVFARYLQILNLCIMIDEAQIKGVFIPKCVGFGGLGGLIAFVVFEGGQRNRTLPGRIGGLAVHGWFDGSTRHMHLKMCSPSLLKKIGLAPLVKHRRFQVDLGFDALALFIVADASQSLTCHPEIFVGSLQEFARDERTRKARRRVQEIG